jgi:catechol 2,3-dioxygenase-like lactoylglutathione lyase family enzyme
MSRSVGVKAIDHVTFVVADLERSRQFYVDVLGMQPAPRPPFDFAGLWFSAGATYVHLILQHDQSGPVRAFIPENCSISRTRHVAFEIDDAEQTIEVLKEHDVAIVAGPKNRPDGPIQLYVLDPDRNLIELFQM